MSSQVSRQIRQVVGDNLRAARKAKGLTLRELGARVGVSEAQMWRWEKGKHKPTDDTLFALAAELGIEYAGLFIEPDLPEAA